MNSMNCMHVGLGRTVIVKASVNEVWNRHRQTDRHTPESCGVLIGWTSLEQDVVNIEFVTEPFEGDSQSRNNFELKDPRHQSRVDLEYRTSGGTMIYLGTWHSHPEGLPSPSAIDKSDWRRCLNRNRNRSLVFVIVGTEKTHIYIPWGRWFRKLREEPI